MILKNRKIYHKNRKKETLNYNFSRPEIIHLINRIHFLKTLVKRLINIGQFKIIQ